MRLPDSFAIKATHGCKMNYLVPDKSKFDSEKCEKRNPKMDEYYIWNLFNGTSLY